MGPRGCRVRSSGQLWASADELSDVHLESAMHPRPPKRPEESPLFKAVSRPETRTKEMASWELLWAVSDLFPRKIQRLLALRRREFGPPPEQTRPEDRARYEAAEIEGAERFVSVWLRRNRIFSPLMLRVALEFVAEEVPSFDSPPMRLSKDGRVEFPSGICANPRREPLSAFLKRAEEHYRAVERFTGSKLEERRAKFKSRDPFRYLAAHLVGGFTIAEIAHQDTPFDTSLIPAAQQQTISQQIHAVAELVGIALSKKRGRRKGAPHHDRLARLRQRK